MLDTILNQRDNWRAALSKRVRCNHVAIGQKGFDRLRAFHARRRGSHGPTTIVASRPRQLFSTRNRGSAISQRWMYQGKHTSCIILRRSVQAQARPTVRCRCFCAARQDYEAYPGDVFYLHSRLLGAARSVGRPRRRFVTSLPIIRTKSKLVSAYIPTNVISITDGQIFPAVPTCSTNQRPAVDVEVFPCPCRWLPPSPRR